jgi:methylthioribose-1-phosphate isomerase
MLPTIARENDEVVMIDQRKLPVQEVYVRCKTAAEVARAIKTMVIRGAPAIGVAASMGVAMGMRKSRATGTQKFAAEFFKTCGGGIGWRVRGPDQGSARSRGPGDS